MIVITRTAHRSLAAVGAAASAVGAVAWTAWLLTRHIAKVDEVWADGFAAGARSAG